MGWCDDVKNKKYNKLIKINKKIQCRKRKNDGKRCKMQTSSKSGYCYYHD